MNCELFSVFDQAAQRFMDPFPAPTVEFAIRAFSEVCTEVGHAFNKHPEDYALYHVGSFDGETAVITVQPAHKIAMAASFLNRFSSNGDESS